MIKICRSFTISILVLLWFVSPSLAQNRIALVIGNSNYTKLQSLPNPGNDARLMAATLTKLGFEVITAVDADRITIGRAVRRFGSTLRKGGKDAVGLFYYAGHGVQARGENYLIPLGAEIESEADLDIEAISANHVLRQMEEAGNSLNLVILDACRNNPFQGSMRSVSRGLVRVQAATGSLIAFAAAPGQTAKDGDGENSPYTKALVKAMQVPGLLVEQMFKQVRVSVEKSTGKKQTPWEESSLKGDFYFVPGTATITNNYIQQSPPQASANLAENAAQERLFWESIKDSDNPKMLAEYIKTYPQGTFAGLATILLEDLKEPEKIPAKTKKQAALTPSNSILPTTNPKAQNAKLKKCDLAAAKPNNPDNPVGIPGVPWVDLDPKTAIPLCEAAYKANPDSQRAAYQLGRAYSLGRRYTQALAVLETPAKAGYAPAQYKLGGMYQFGFGVTKSYTEAVRWYRKAAEQGNSNAQVSLGRMYRYGYGVTKSNTEAVRWYRKAAEQGYASAQTTLGWMYKNGIGVSKSYTEAVRWYRKAAEQGNASAQTTLGRMYQNGSGVTKSYTEAARWHRKAAEQGNAGAQTTLGWMYRNGYGVTKSYTEAVRWYRKAAEKGNAKAQYDLGWMYRNGYGVTKSYTEAVRWYRKAAGNGMSAAYYTLGGLYEEGKGVPRDSKHAANLMFKAIKGGHRFSQKQMVRKSKLWSQQFRRELQRKMKTEGYYNGPIDGSFGPATIRAIEKVAAG